MLATTTRDLIQRVLARRADKTTDTVDAVLREPANVFVSRARHDAEVSQLFLDTPQLIGFSPELALNTYQSRDVLGVPVLLTRDPEGKLRAFVNACRHRGAQVADDSGQSSRLTCPFHGWSYQLDGTLAGRREAECFNSTGADAALLSLPVAEPCGLIVLGLHTAMTQSRVETALQEIQAELNGFDFTTMHLLETRRIEVNANWKLVASLSHEGYHFASLHRNSVAEMLESTFVHDTFERHSRWAFPLKGLEQWRDQPESEWPRFFPGAVNHTLYPGATVLITNPEDAQMIRVEPGSGPDSSVVYFTGVYRDAARLEESIAMFEFGYQVFTEEDLPVAEACQRGLSAGLPHIEIGRNEPVVQFWHRLWRESLGGY